jgi:Zn-dependent protease
MKCHKCQQETFLPFTCPHCGQHFCTQHRLPENHQCPNIQQARQQKTQQQTTPHLQKQKPQEYTITYIETAPKTTKTHFSKTETKHLTIATILVICAGLSLALFPITPETQNLPTLAAFTAILTTSFLTHEIAHKTAAQKKGLWAEFRLNLTSTALTLISIISPLFKIISPGAVMISGFADVKTLGKISLIGPTTNILLATAFLTAAFPISQYHGILLLGAAFNAWIALFNLIPFGMFDGFKVFLWNKTIWALTFTASIALTATSYNYLLNYLL